MKLERLKDEGGRVKLERLKVKTEDED